MLVENHASFLKSILDGLYLKSFKTLLFIHLVLYAVEEIIKMCLLNL